MRGRSRARPAAVVLTGGHREEAIDSSSTGSGRRDSRRAPPDGAATGRAAPTLRARRAPGARARPLEAARRRGDVAGAVRDGLRAVGTGPGRSTCSGSAARCATPCLSRLPLPPLSPPSRARPAQHLDMIGHRMRFLRMRPGHGEELIAEGDPRSRKDEGGYRGVPPPAGRRMWNAVPTRAAAVAARPGWSRRSTRSRRTPTGDLLPARLRRLTAQKAHAPRARRPHAVRWCCGADAYIRPFSWQSLERLAQPSAPASSLPTTPAASAAPSSAPASSCARA